jgi:perosamine synthetase
MVAALGCSQIERIERLIDGRRTAAHQMTEQIEEIPGVEPSSEATGRHVYQLYTVTLDTDIDRRSVIETFNQHGIATKIYWDPIHKNSQFEENPITSDGLEVTESVADRVLSLPIHPELTRKEIDRIVSALKEAVADV